jgi:hypothetical protein
MITAVIDDNYERIRSDLVSLGLTSKRLLDDMLDHVCCMVEEEMGSGNDFESSYRRVMDTIPDGQLPLIQHQVMLNLDKKYQRMKKITYVFGLISALVMILGAVMKKLHGPGAGILLTVGVLMTVFGFLPLYFRSSYLEMKERRKPVYSIVGYITVSLILLGVLFKSMHWPGAAVMLTVGVVMTIVGFLPFYFRTSYRELKEKKNPIYGIVGYIAMSLLLLGALFKILHWPGAGIILYTSVGFLVIGFIPLYVVNIFQRSGKDKILLPYLVAVLVAISLVMLIGDGRMSNEALELYRVEAASDEIQIEKIRERTAALIEGAGDAVSGDRRPALLQIRDEADELLALITQMQTGLKEFVEQPGVDISAMTKLDNRRAGREVVVDSGLGRDFVAAARDFREMLDEFVTDPVTMSQIDHHLHLTADVGTMEYGGTDVIISPLIRVYYMNGAAAKGVALSEYVAIASLLHRY